MSLNLESFGLSTAFGFLPTEPLKNLNINYSAWDELSQEMPFLLNAGAFRNRVLQMPVLSIDQLNIDVEGERALLLLTSFANAYVWEGYESSKFLPLPIAKPLFELSQLLKRKPILTHSSIGLNNWAKLDNSAPFELNNLRTLVQFHGGVDESWFFLVTVMIEKIGGNVLKSIQDIYSNLGNENGIKKSLEEIEESILAMNSCLNRMYEWCEPAIYHQRLRPFLTSFKEIVYDLGDRKETITLHGGSAAQSALLQSIDAFFGVQQKQEHAKHYLLLMRDYMPVRHAAFVRKIEEDKILPALLAKFPLLKPQFNDALNALNIFRQSHLELVAKYIMGQTERKGSGQVGTGGTNPMVFLKEVKKQTELSKI